MTSPRIRPNHKRWLLVEGKDDLHAIIALTTRHGHDWQAPDARLPFVNDAGGDTKAREELVERMSATMGASMKSLTHLGIVLDADLGAADRWASLKAVLRSYAIECPETLPEDGIVFTEPARLPYIMERLGVWIMPDNSSSGMLEDFLRGLVPAADPCLPLAERIVDEAKKAGAPYLDTHRPKALIHTWLAWQDPPGRPFGTALTARVLAHDTPLALSFLQWFERLYLE